MLAPRAYLRGETMIGAEAFLIGPSCGPFHFQGNDGVLRYPVNKPICLGCYKFLDGKYKCSRCHWPVCDAVCENVAWHADYECHLLVQKKREYGGMKKDKIMYYQITLLRGVLLSNRSPTQWARVEAAVEARARDFELTCKSSFMAKLAKLIEITFNLCKNSLQPRRVAGIYRMLQLDGIFNHLPRDRCCTVIYAELLPVTFNCVPNGRYIHLPPVKPTEPFTIRFYALDDLPQGTPITRCLDESLLLQGTFNRRSGLKDLFQYICECPRCVDPTELGTNMSAVGCPKAECRAEGGRVLPVAPLDERFTAVWKCSLCKYKTTQKEVRDFLDVAVGLVVQSTLVSPENVLGRSAFVNLVEGAEQILTTGASIVGTHHYSLLPLRMAILGLISNSLSTLDDPTLRNIYAQKMVDEVHVLIFIMHHVMPGIFPIKGKTYYWMAKALMTHLISSDETESMVTTRELLQFVIFNHLPSLKLIQDTPLLPGIGDVTSMIEDLELWKVQFDGTLPLPLPAIPLPPPQTVPATTTDTKKPEEKPSTPPEQPKVSTAVRMSKRAERTSKKKK